MLLNNGGTLSLYALKRKNPTKIQRKPNTYLTKLQKRKEMLLTKEKSYLTAIYNTCDKNQSKEYSNPVPVN